MPASNRMTASYSTGDTRRVSEGLATAVPSPAPPVRLPIKPPTNLHIADDGPSPEVMLARLLGIAVERAAALIEDYDAVAPLVRANVAELRARHGLTQRQATRLKGAVALTLRLLHGSGQERPQIKSPRDVADLMRPHLAGLPHEEVWVLLLDTTNRVVAQIQLYIGTVDSCQIRISELFRAAVRRNARNLILVHNHPSQDCVPSPEDVSLTREAVRAGQLLGIEVLDHIVLGGHMHVSLKERGLGWND